MSYQFDTHFLIRFLARYDSSARRVLTDLLASYGLVPPCFTWGDGSLLESVNRVLFLKAS